MTNAKRSPKIAHLSWGRMEIEGGHSGKDFKLYPGGARAWDWTETGTEHVPGIQPADVKELVDRGAKVIVLSKGIQNRLDVMTQTLDWLSDRGVPAHVLQTEEAVELYNRLSENEAVGGLFHSTC
jgi:hypothetical protein